MNLRNESIIGQVYSLVDQMPKEDINRLVTYLIDKKVVHTCVYCLPINTIINIICLSIANICLEERVTVEYFLKEMI